MSAILTLNLLLASAAGPGDPIPEVNVPELTVEAAQSVIQQGDPLLVKVKVANYGPRDVRFPTLLSTATGLLRLDLRIDGANWHDVTVGGNVTIDGAEFAVKPNETFATYSILSRALDQSLLFPTPGTYELRARATHEAGTLVSPPIRITVSEAPQAKLDLLKTQHGRQLAAYLTVAPGAAKAMERLHLPEPDTLPNGLLRKLGEGQRAFMAWEGSDSGTAAETDARDALQAAVSSLDATTREWYLLGIAQQYYTWRRYGEMREVLYQLPDPTDVAKSLRRMAAETFVPAPVPLAPKKAKKR